MASKTKTATTTATGQATKLKTKHTSRELSRLLEKGVNDFGEEVERNLDENPAIVSAKDEGDINNPESDGKPVTAETLQRDDYADPDDIPPGMPWERNSGGVDGERYVPEQASEQSLQDYLMEQVRQRDLTDGDIIIAEYIVGNIDSNGYLLRSPRAIADDITFNAQLNTEPDQVERVLEVVRSLDPPGIAAINLHNCLMLQLSRCTGDDAKQAMRIVDTHLDDLGRRRYDAIASDLQMSRDEVKRLFETVIRKLNPKPGSAFTGGTSEGHHIQIMPDFFVEVDDDKLSITLNNKIPELVISEAYEKESLKAATTQRGRDQQKIIRRCYDQAKAFIDLVKMRQETLFGCMREICRRQYDYFITGDVIYIKPMKLEDIAGAVGRDVSVISRAMANKYVDTPWGVKPLNFFFSENVNGASSTAIKETIRQIIEGEDATNPFTDEQLRAELEKCGYAAPTRRTITKYREAMSIPSSTERRKTD